MRGNGVAMVSRDLWLVLAAIILPIACSPDKEPAGMGKTEPPQGHKEALKAVEAGRYEKAGFAAGCFWGVEAAFRKVDGVVSTAVGYTGGHTDSPTYEQVCTDRTGHAETVEVIYDPSKVTYEQLLEAFWLCHDPTQVNRQGPDVGSQYRSAIFFHTPQQEALARASKAALQQSGKYTLPIVTEILPAPKFHMAEEYHQRYLEKRRGASCGPGH